jgi:hypothetical protein
MQDVPSFLKAAISILSTLAVYQIALLRPPEGFLTA